MIRPILFPVLRSLLRSELFLPSPTTGIQGPTTPPSISGSPHPGQTLTATPGTWPSGPVTGQWYKDGLPLAGETSTTFAVPFTFFPEVLLTYVENVGAVYAGSNVMTVVRDDVFLDDTGNFYVDENVALYLVNFAVSGLVAPYHTITVDLETWTGSQITVVGWFINGVSQGVTATSFAVPAGTAYGSLVSFVVTSTYGGDTVTRRSLDYFNSIDEGFMLNGQLLVLSGELLTDTFLF